MRGNGIGRVNACGWHGTHTHARSVRVLRRQSAYKLMGQTGSLSSRVVGGFKPLVVSAAVPLGGTANSATDALPPQNAKRKRALQASEGDGAAKKRALQASEGDVSDGAATKEGRHALASQPQIITHHFPFF